MNEVFTYLGLLPRSNNSENFSSKSTTEKSTEFEQAKITLAYLMCSLVSKNSPKSSGSRPILFTRFLANKNWKKLAKLAANDDPNMSQNGMSSQNENSNNVPNPKLPYFQRALRRLRKSGSLKPQISENPIPKINLNDQPWHQLPGPYRRFKRSPSRKTRSQHPRRRGRRRRRPSFAPSVLTIRWAFRRETSRLVALELFEAYNAIIEQKKQELEQKKQKPRRPKIPPIPISKEQQPPKIPPIPISKEQQPPKILPIPISKEQQQPKQSSPISKEQQPPKQSSPISKEQQPPKQSSPISKNKKLPTTRPKAILKNRRGQFVSNVLVDASNQAYEKVMRPRLEAKQRGVSQSLTFVPSQKFMMRKFAILFIKYYLNFVRGMLRMAQIFCLFGAKLTQLKAMVKLFPDAVTRKMPIVGYILNMSDPFEGALLCICPLGPEVSGYFDPRRFLVPVLYKLIGRFCYMMSRHLYQIILSDRVYAFKLQKLAAAQRAFSNYETFKVLITTLEQHKLNACDSETMELLKLVLEHLYEALPEYEDLAPVTYEVISKDIIYSRRDNGRLKFYPRPLPTRINRNRKIMKEFPKYFIEAFSCILTEIFYKNR